MAPTDLAAGPPLLLKATAAMYAQDTVSSGWTVPVAVAAAGVRCLPTRRGSRVRRLLCSQGAPKLTKAQKRQAAKSKQAMMIWLPVVIVVNVSFGALLLGSARPHVAVHASDGARAGPALCSVPSQAIYGYFGVASRVQSVSVLEWILTALSLAGHWYAYASILESWSEAKVSSAKARSECVPVPRPPRQACRPRFPALFPLAVPALLPVPPPPLAGELASDSVARQRPLGRPLSFCPASAR